MSRSAIGRTGTIVEHDDRHHGLYRAVVHDNNDPNYRGRVQVIIPEVSGPEAPHPEWADPALGFGNGNGKVWGSTLALPEVGDVVWVVFVAREPGGVEDFPVWLPGWAIDNATPSLLKTNYPKRRGLVTPSGHALYFDDSDGSVMLSQSDGAQLVLDGQGNADLSSKSGEKVKLQGGGRPSSGKGHAVDLGTWSVVMGSGGIASITIVPPGGGTPITLSVTTPLTGVPLNGQISEGSLNVEIDG